MNRLKHITFTGVDRKTDIKTLKEIQQKWPAVEFGVLTSYHWYDNGNRYLDPMLIEERLRGEIRGLSLHVCGQAARDAAFGDWNKIDKLVWMNLGIFDRVQLNIASYNDILSVRRLSKITEQEVIIQAKGVDNTAVYDASSYLADRDKFGRTVSVLLDASGGMGIDTPLRVFPSPGKVGYAGGFNPDNVEEKLSYLLENVKQGSLWIDMESGVRTDDWFDLNKVVSVLEVCDKVLSNI